MIIDHIQNIHRYNWAEAFLKAFEHAASFIHSPGKTALWLDDYLNCTLYETRDITETLPEAHRLYADIQMLYEGREQIAVYPEKSLKILEAYDKDKDVEFYEARGNCSLIDLTPGVFAVFFPGEIHQPGITTGVKAQNKKMIYKLKMTGLTG